MNRDLRKFTRQTRFRLIAGAVLLFLIIGEGLIYWLYGPSAAVTGLICMGAGLLPVAIIVLVLQIIEWIVKKSNPDE